MANCSRGWSNRCPSAKGKRCTCKCGGENHGKAHQGTATLPTETGDNLNEAMQILNAAPVVRVPATYQGFAGHIVTKDGAMLLPELSLKIWNHSPTGFSWGYAGSGPAQLALAILLEETDQKTASALHQLFKFEVVAGLASEWTLTSAQVQEWLEEAPTA